MCSCVARCRELHGGPDCNLPGHRWGFGLLDRCRSRVAPLLPVKGSLDMQSDSLITVLSFCFLSDSPLDSHVNMRTCYRRTCFGNCPLPSHDPKGWLPLSPPGSVKGTLYQWLWGGGRGEWYCLVVSDLWGLNDDGCRAGDVLKKVKHVGEPSSSWT